MKILKFYAPWCGPCKQQGEFLSKVTGVEVQDVNIEEDDILQEVHRVRSVPMMVLLDDKGETLREEQLQFDHSSNSNFSNSL